MTSSRANILLYGITATAFFVTLAGTFFGPYGLFIDELYYIACAKRLAWGYVDHPPLSILLLSATRTVLGESVLALRLPPALATAGTVLVAGLLARRLGGGAYAQALAALATATGPVFLVLGTFYSMNAFELLLWPLVALVLLRILDGDAPRLWLVVGLLLGLGLENKHTTILLAVAVAAGIVATRARGSLATPWPWLGALLAALMLLPNLLWQQAHGWPSVEFYRNAQAFKNIPTPPFKAVMDQILFLGPATFPVWLSGTGYLLFARRAAPYRPLGIAFLVLFAILLASHSSRPDRIGAFYPVVFAAGGVALEALTAASGRRWGRAALVAMILLGAGPILPLSLPLFQPRTVAAYAQTIHYLPRIERGKTSPIPQWLADRTGWEEFVDDVAAVYRTLPPEDQAKVVFYAPSYGQAGALELLGPSRGLPPRVICPQNTYWMWSKERPGPQVLIAVDANPRDLDTAFAEHALIRTHHCDYCMSWRNDARIEVARGLRVPWGAAWETTKHYE
jgi:hypothetical protein